MIINFDTQLGGGWVGFGEMSNTHPTLEKKAYYVCKIFRQWNIKLVI
jgi:hypothetical protein